MATKRVYYQYKDKKDNRIIDSDKIVADDENGIIEHLEGASFRYISKENLSKEAIAADYGYDRETIPVPRDVPDASAYDKTKIPGTPKLLGEYYDYTFGIEKIEIKQTEPLNVSGFISNEINIGNCNYIEIAVNLSSKNSSIEYSIVDGIKEVPIMPIEESIIFREKLFYGLDTRFLPDLKKNIIVYKNGEIVQTSFESIRQKDIKNEEYSITYYPMKDSHRYVPSNKKIKLKVIERCLKKEVPAIINSIVILKYGGTNTWNT